MANRYKTVFVLFYSQKRIIGILEYCLLIWTVKQTRFLELCVQLLKKMFLCPFLLAIRNFIHTVFLLSIQPFLTENQSNPLDNLAREAVKNNNSNGEFNKGNSRFTQCRKQSCRFLPGIKQHLIQATWFIIHCLALQNQIKIKVLAQKSGEPVSAGPALGMKN